MVTGRLLAAVLLFLAAWLMLLCLALWKRLKTREPLHRSVRSRLTYAGMVCATIALATLLGIGLSWVSVTVSQQFAGTAFTAFLILLFFSTIAALILCAAGSGVVRWFGFATALLTGYCFFAIWLGAGLSGGAPIVRHPMRVMIPQGYVGWVKIRYGRQAPPLPISNGTLICRIPPTGVLETSSTLEDGWARDQFFYYSQNGARRELRDTGWGGGGMVWGANVGWQQQENGSNRTQIEQNFYIGLEDQFRRGEHHPADDGITSSF